MEKWDLFIDMALNMWILTCEDVKITTQGLKINQRRRKINSDNAYLLPQLLQYKEKLAAGI